MDEPLVLPVTMDEFQEMFDFVYSEPNRRFSTDQLLHLLTETAVIGVLKNARKGQEERMLEQLANVRSRTNSVANKLKINLQQAQWYKYPDICPYCRRRKNCQCMLNHPREINLESDPVLVKMRKKTGRMVTRLRDHQLLQKRIYYNQNQLFNLDYLAQRLVEETCEVSEAFRAGNMKLVASELADVDSFTFAICNLVNKNRREHEYVYIDELTLQYYPYQCKKCHRNVCCGKCGRKIAM